jgi:hypothetical protein
MSRPVRHVRARNGWHAAWLLVVETVLHPRTETVIHKREHQCDGAKAERYPVVIDREADTEWKSL